MAYFEKSFGPFEIFTNLKIIFGKILTPPPNFFFLNPLQTIFDQVHQ